MEIAVPSRENGPKTRETRKRERERERERESGPAEWRAPAIMVRRARFAMHLSIPSSLVVRRPTHPIWDKILSEMSQSPPLPSPCPSSALVSRSLSHFSLKSRVSRPPSPLTSLTRRRGGIALLLLTDLREREGERTAEALTARNRNPPLS